MWVFSKPFLLRYASLLPSIFTLLNTSIGVIALAMPYCFHQCGILLSVICLGVAALVCIASCDILITLCVSNNLTTFDLVCLNRLGYVGKLISEISGIGLLIGFIVGYNVSVVDLGGIITSYILNIAPAQSLRVVILILFTAAITPLCLVQRVQNFARLSTFAMFFYFIILVHMTFALAVPRLLSDPLCLSQMTWWRPAGLPSCLPIMFGAIFCQPQILTVYASLHQPSVEALRDVVRVSVAVILVTYGLFGFFGCIAFAGAKTLLGNVFLMYPNDLMSFGVQMGFLLTVTVSIPLTMFPLRQSIHTFFFHKVSSQQCQLPTLEPSDGFTVPPKLFRLITLCILVLCFTVSLTMDKIEVIIKLTSSLAGSLIGYILPALVLLLSAGVGSSSVSSAKERRLTLFLLGLGILLVFLELFPVYPSPVPATAVDRPQLVRPGHVPAKLEPGRVVPAPVMLQLAQPAGGGRKKEPVVALHGILPAALPASAPAIANRQVPQPAPVVEAVHPWNEQGKLEALKQADAQVEAPMAAEVDRQQPPPAG